ncbi:MAG: rhomboid family intramembrane serine protease [Lysobacteraceae bacterium]
MEISINWIIIGITAVVSYLALQDGKLMARLIFWPPAVSKGREYYRLLSYGLIHADFTHFLFNMITLYFFGRLIEQVYNAIAGPAGYALFYAGALLASILPSYFRHRNDAGYRSLGASGAVSAVLFTFILFDPWALIFIFFIPMPAIVYAVAYTAYSIYMDRKGGDNVNHSAHLWGAAYGVLVTIIIEPRVLGIFLERLATPSFMN